MYYLNITNKWNQTIYFRAKEIARHPGEEIVAVIDNRKEYTKEEWLKFQFPLYSEGISKIVLKEDNSNVEELFKIAKEREKFKHHDKWHGDETLKEHDDRIREILKENINVSDEAILLHDFGKPLTVKSNPKDDQWLCYYNHENIGTRDILSYLSTKDINQFYNILTVCNYHMMFINKEWSMKNRPEVFKVLEKENVIELLEEFSKADNALPKEE